MTPIRSGCIWPVAWCALRRSELDAWASHPKQTIQATVFDSSDGVSSHRFPGGYSSVVAKSADGKLWFVRPGGVSVIDPQHLPFNKLPPPVHIEQITADRKTYDAAQGHAPARASSRPRDRLHRAELRRAGEGPFPLQAGRLRQRVAGRRSTDARRSTRTSLRAPTASA